MTWLAVCEKTRNPHTRLNQEPPWQDWVPDQPHAMELKMNNNLASNADQNRALTEEELDAVTGASFFTAIASMLRKAGEAARDADLDFARGDIMGGLRTLAGN